MNKKAVFAGSFYPDRPDELTNLLNSYKQDIKVAYKSKAIIVPHAGVYYSGYAAMAGFQHLELNENIFIIAPSHHNNFDNIALPNYTYFDTPLGRKKVFLDTHSVILDEHEKPQKIEEIKPIFEVHYCNENIIRTMHINEEKNFEIFAKCDTDVAICVRNGETASLNDIPIRCGNEA